MIFFGLTINVVSNSFKFLFQHPFVQFYFLSCVYGGSNCSCDSGSSLVTGPMVTGVVAAF